MSYILKRNGIIIYEGDDKAFNDTGLVGGTEYNYTLTEINKFGQSVEKAITVTTKPRGSALTLKASNVRATSMTLTWTSHPGAMQYVLTRNDGQTYREIYRGPNLSFNDTGLVSETIYTYNLYAIDPYGQTPTVTIRQRARDYGTLINMYGSNWGIVWRNNSSTVTGKVPMIGFEFSSGPYAGTNPNDTFRAVTLTGVDIYYAYSVSDPGTTNFTQADISRYQDDSMPLPTTFHDISGVDRTNVRYKKFTDVQIEQPPRVTGARYWYHIGKNMGNSDMQLGMMYKATDLNTRTDFTPSRVHIFCKIIARTTEGETTIGGKELPWFEFELTNGSYIP